MAAGRELSWVSQPSKGFGSRFGAGLGVTLSRCETLELLVEEMGWVRNEVVQGNPSHLQVL